MNKQVTLFIPKQSWITIILISFVGASFNLQLPCFTSIRDSLGTSDVWIQSSLVLGPALSILSCIFFIFLGNKESKNLILFWCILSFFVGSFICGLSINIKLFLIGRCLQVLGDSGITTIAFSFLADFHKDKELGKVLGISAITNTVSNVFSPLLGSWFLSHFNWRCNFFLLATICLPFLINFYTYKNPHSYNQTQDKCFSCENSIVHIKKCIKNYTFMLGCLIPALYATIGSLFDFFSPFFYMDICSFSSNHFAIIRVIITLVGMIGSFTYIYLLKHRDIQTILLSGTFIHIFYILGTGWLLMPFERESPYLLLFFHICQILSASLIGPIGMIKSLSCFKGEENVTMALFSLARNILSTLFCFISMSLSNTSIYTIISLMFFLSIINLMFLILLKRMH